MNTAPLVICGVCRLVEDRLVPCPEHAGCLVLRLPLVGCVICGARLQEPAWFVCSDACAERFMAGRSESS